MHTCIPIYGERMEKEADYTLCLVQYIDGIYANSVL